MAEERLIDDDKDRKYKVIKNADGEEELVLVPQGEDEEREEPVFEVSEQESDDEEAAVLTPEQLAELKRAREEEEKRILEETEEKLKKARKAVADGEYESAREVLAEAEEIAPENGEVYKLKLIAESCGLSDFTRIDECVDAAKGVAEYCDDGQKNELCEVALPLYNRIEEVKVEVERLNEENERKKDERRPVFQSRAKTATKFFAISSAVFVALAIVAAVFASMIYAREDGTNVVLTIVFASLAGAAFIVFLVAAHKIWVAKRNLKLNENNLRTKVGREYEKNRAELEKLNAVAQAIKVNNDLS